MKLSYAMNFVFIFFLASMPVLSQDAGPSQGAVDQLRPGEVFSYNFGIAYGDYGSDSVDMNEIVTFTAPSGTVILGHEIYWSGHHSSASWVETNQSGNISYNTGVLSELSDEMRKGFASGSLTYKGVNFGSANAAANYANFLREFRANYQFRTSTNSSISFRWRTQTRTGKYGAKINAYATIYLKKTPTEEDAERAVEAIKFVIESGQQEDIFNLMNSVLSGKSARELGL